MFCLQEVGTEERALRPKGRQNPPGVQGGAAGALRAHKAGGGGLWPRPLLWFGGPFGPAKCRRPPRGPTAAAVPGGDATPSVIRRLPRGRREARRGPMGGGGVWRRGGPMGRPASACRKTPGGSGAAAPGGFDRIWRHKVNCPEGTREGPLGGARQIRKKPCVARVSLHSSLAAP